MTQNFKSMALRSGFTLIETAIALLIIGLLITPLFVLYNNYVNEKRVEETYINVQDVIEKIDDFRVVNGYYPCPAPMKVGVNDPLYGVDSCAEDAAAGIGPGGYAGMIPTGSCDTDLGLCVEESVRGGLTNPRVIVGMIPFRDLQIDEADAYDAYGGRIVYAVTESMSSLATIDDSEGAISIKDLTDDALSDVAGSFAAIAYSHGANRLGSYNKNASLSRPCNPASIEAENCITGFEDGVANEAEYVTAFKRGDFDDVVIYFMDNSPPLWQRIDGNVENIRDLSTDGVAIGKVMADDVALDISRPTIGGDDSIHVRGTYNAITNPEGTQGVIVQPRGSRICHDNGTEETCLDVTTLFGGAQFRCPSGQFARGISNGAIVCSSVVEISCDQDPNRPILNGINPDGTPNCVEIPQEDCPQVTVNVAATCNNPLTLPQANHGTVIEIDETQGFVDAAGRHAVDIVGNCAVAQYQCVDGAWQLTGSSGAGGRCGVEFPTAPLPSYCDDDDPSLECTPCPVPGTCGHFCVAQRYVCDINDEFEPFAPTPVAAPTANPAHADAYWAVSVEYDTPTNTSECTCPPRPDEETRVSCRQHFSNPSYFSDSGSPNWTVSPPSYGTSGPAISTRTYGSATWPSCAGTNGPWDTSQCSCIAPTTELDAPPVLIDGNPTTKRYLANCPTGKIVDTANPMGLPAGNMGIVRQDNWNGSINDCQWQYASQIADYCICDPTPWVYSQPHTPCDPVCEMPDPLFPDWFKRVRDPGSPSCAYGPAIPLTPSTDPAKPLGQCKPRPFTWVRVGTSGEQAAVVPPSAINIGDACSCQDHQDTQGPDDYVICYPSSSNDIEYCRCQSSF